MYASNFSLKDIGIHGFSVVVNAYGFEWDLHNFAEFEGFEYSVETSAKTLTLKWRISERIRMWRDTGQYGVPNYPSDHFCIRFTAVDYLKIIPRDAKMPTDEDLGLSFVSYIDASEDTAPYLAP